MLPTGWLLGAILARAIDATRLPYSRHAKATKKCQGRRWYQATLKATVYARVKPMVGVRSRVGVGPGEVERRPGRCTTVYVLDTVYMVEQAHL